MGGGSSAFPSLYSDFLKVRDMPLTLDTCRHASIWQNVHREPLLQVWLHDVCRQFSLHLHNEPEIEAVLILFYRQGN